MNTDPAMYEIVWGEVSSEEFIMVPCVPINSIMDKFSKIDLLKIDCEGSEMSFLPCLTKENREKICYVVGEVHPSEKHLHRCNSYHNDGDLIRKFLPEFKFIVENKIFFGWK